jgi:hypothetical protein
MLNKGPSWVGNMKDIEYEEAKKADSGHMSLLCRLLLAI